MDLPRYWTRASHSGVRLLITHETGDPQASATERIFDSLGCDALYRRLTHTQRSFRARLTPKPWRCGLPRPPAAFPFENETAEAQFHAWEQTYSARTTDFATCRLLEQVGDIHDHPVIKAVVDVHDLWTLAEGKPLA